MLPFKRKFLDLIRSGEKTQTLRIWKSLRVKVGQKEMIPGIGFVWIDSAEKVTFDDLTDADAILDGFESVALLREEIRAIYGDLPAGTLYRIRFHLLDSSKENESYFPVKSQTSEESVHTDTAISIKPSESPQDSESRKSETATVPPTEEVDVKCKGFVNEMRQQFAEKMGSFFQKEESLPQTSETSENSSEIVTEKVETPKSLERLTEEQIVEKMIRRCRINRNVCDWNHEPGKSQDFFTLFKQAPRNERGIPILDGYRLRSLMRDQTSETEWEEICWIASEVCAAWTEWQYALEHWEI